MYNVSQTYALTESSGLSYSVQSRKYLGGRSKYPSSIEGVNRQQSLFKKVTRKRLDRALTREERTDVERRITKLLIERLMSILRRELVANVNNIQEIYQQ